MNKYLLLLLMLMPFYSHSSEPLYWITSHSAGCPARDIRNGFYNEAGIALALPQVGDTCVNGDSLYTITRVNISTSSFRLYYEIQTGSSTRKSELYGKLRGADNCPEGTELDPVTGRCEKNPCKEHEGKTVDVGWYARVFGASPPSSSICSSYQCTATLVSGTDFHDETATSGYDSIATYKVTSNQCTSSPNTDNPFCTDESCSEGLPTPNPDPDPTPDPDPDPDPNIPPITDDNPLPPGNGNQVPDPTEPIEEPEPTEPEDTPDETAKPTETVSSEETTKAITNLNQDNNENFAKLNTQLEKLRKADEAINANMAKQLQQDFEIYENMKKQMNSNTDYLGERIDATGNSLYNQIGKLNTDLSREVDNIGDQISDKIDGLGGKVDGLGDDLNAIADKICDPRVENCEGEHGLTQNGIQSMFDQLQGGLENQADDADQGLMDELTKLANNPVIGQDEPDAMKGMILDAIPTIGDCSPLVLKAAGKTFVIDCRFSKEAKMIISWIIYVLTAVALFNIVTEGITPNDVPYSRRRMH